MSNKIKPMLQPAARLFCAAVLTAATFGCSSSLKQAVNEPSKLVALSQNTPALEQSWSYSLGGANSKDPLRLQIAKTETGFFAASRQGKVVKLSANGRKHWSKNINSHITSGVVANEQMLIVADDKGYVYAMNVQDGSLLWKQPLAGLVLAPALLTQNRVVVMTNNGLVAGLDTNTGKPVWQFKINIPQFSLRGSAKPVQLSNNFAVVSAADGRVHAFRIDSGIPMWVRRVASSTGKSDFERLHDVDADPLFYQFNLYTAGFQSHVLGIEMKNRSEIFKTPASSTKSLAANNKHLYVSNTTGEVVALDRSNGNTLWKQSALKYRQLSNPVTTANYVYVGDADGYVHTLDANTGDILGRVRTSGAIHQLVLTDNHLLIQTASGKLSAWQTLGNTPIIRQEK